MAHPVSEKKLIEDGVWDTRKEILGWLFDGMARTIELPQRKCDELLLKLKAVRRLPKLEVNRFQKLHGRLQFATIAIPCGKPIFGQVNWYMSSAAKNRGRNLIVMTNLQAILRDWSALMRLVGKRPTHVAELIKHPPSYQGFVDASKWGVGGVWFSSTKQLVPIVWFYEWPQDIRDQFRSSFRSGTHRNPTTLACPGTHCGNRNTPRLQRLNLVRQPPCGCLDVQIQNKHVTSGSTNTPGSCRPPIR
jgi:hypothetical protein